MTRSIRSCRWPLSYLPTTTSLRWYRPATSTVMGIDYGVDDAAAGTAFLGRWSTAGRFSGEVEVIGRTMNNGISMPRQQQQQQQHDLNPEIHSSIQQHRRRQRQNCYFGNNNNNDFCPFVGREFHYRMLPLVKTITIERTYPQKQYSQFRRYGTTTMSSSTIPNYIGMGGVNIGGDDDDHHHQHHEYNPNEGTNNDGRSQPWNVKADEFLKGISRTSSIPTERPPDDDEVQQRQQQQQQQEMVVTIQELLEHLLQITYAMKHNVRSGSQVVDDQDDTADGNLGGSNDMGGPIDVHLAFALMDTLVELEMGKDTTVAALHDQLSQVQTRCLNPILQLWKIQFISMMTTSTVPTTETLLTPSDILSKLDLYRQHSNILVPDIQSYNILLDAVASGIASTATTGGRTPQKKNNNSNLKMGNRIHKSNYVDVRGVNIGFGHNLWQWLWKESKTDSLLRPDLITVRTLFKAHAATGHPRAPVRCEELMNEWMEHHRSNNKNNNQTEQQSSNSSSSSAGKDDSTPRGTIQSPTRDGGVDDEQRGMDNSYYYYYDPRGSLLESLIHVWAPHDPRLAERYLRKMVRQYVEGESSYPPSTVAWNRVISAYAVLHDHPVKAHQVLEEFWDFSSDQTQQRQQDGYDDDGPNAVAWKVGRPNLRSYNTVLEGYARQTNARGANRVLARLQSSTSTPPTVASYTSAMKANVKDLDAVETLARRYLDDYMADQERDSQPRVGMDDFSESDGEEEESNSLTLDHAFFHARLYACARARNIDTAKNVMKEMKRHKLLPKPYTYLAFLEVFLAKDDTQSAIEWLLAYAKLEGMEEGTVVAWTCRLLRRAAGSGSYEVDSMILLQILVENAYITQDQPLEQLLLGISGLQGKAVLGWIPRPTLKMRVIVMRALAQFADHSPVVEELYREWQREYHGKVGSHTTGGDYDNELVAKACASLIVAWSKREDLPKIQYWLAEFEKDPQLPPLNVAAQTAILSTLCKVSGPRQAEDYLLRLKAAHNEGKSPFPPDTVMVNIVLNGWAQTGQGDRAAALLRNHVRQPDTFSYNSVVNAFSKEGKMDEAEKYATELVDMYRRDPIESKRPDSVTFTSLLAGWRRSGNFRAAERSERVLKWMNDLHNEGIIWTRPNLKSYQVVLDTLAKSSRRDVPERAVQLVASSPFRNDSQLLEKVRIIQSQPWRKGQGGTNRLVEGR